MSKTRTILSNPIYEGGFSDNTPDLIYYNATIINGNQTDVEAFPHPDVKFNETRDQPIVSDASKYYMSVLRTIVNGSNLDLPLFLCPIQINQDDVNLSIFSITLVINKNITTGTGEQNFQYTYQQFMEWSPENQTAPIPPAPTPFQWVDTTYYWAYTFNHVVGLFNTTIETAYNAIQTAFNTWWPLNGGVGDAPALLTAVPFMNYNGQTNLFSLYFDQVGYNTSEPLDANIGEQWQFWGNSNFYNLFNSFPSLLYSGRDSNFGQGCLYETYNNYGLNLYTYNDITYYVMTQDYPTTGAMWSPIDAIVLSTTLLPVVSEATGTPLLANNNNTSTTTQNAFFPILTDIAIAQTSAANYKSDMIYYAPSGSYRFTTLSNSHNPINNIDLQLYWRNRQNQQLYPLTMPAQSSVSIKLLFQKRTINTVR